METDLTADEINVIMGKGRWVICTCPYEYDGDEIPKGRMFYDGSIPIQNKRWRTATADEIETKKWHKGNWYNLKNV